MDIARVIRLGGLGLGLAALTLIACLIGLQLDTSAYVERGELLTPSATSLPSFLFRFDPTSQTFYTYPLPNDSLPYGVVVTGTNPTQVWVADSGRDRIGRLVYTNTSDILWIEYPVTTTSNSEPFRLAVAGDFIWFTERGADRIGRLDVSTGQIVEFYGHGLTPNAGLAGITVAPDGQIWATGESSNRLIRLTITSTADYAFNEYLHPLLVGPFALAIESDIPPSYNVWFTEPGVRRVGRFTPDIDMFVLPSGFPTDSVPYEIVTPPGFIWFSDRGYNSIDQIEIGTLPIINAYRLVPRPSGLASESSRVLWMTQQDDRGGLARFIYTSTSSIRFDFFALPTAGLRPTGIAVAADKGVWFAAFTPQRVYLPIVLRN